MRNLPKILVKSLVVWASTVAILSALIVATYILKGSPYDKFINESGVGSAIGIILLLVSAVSFIIFFFNSLFYIRKKKWFSSGKRLIRILKVVLILLSLPLILIFDLIKPLIKLVRGGQAKALISKEFLKDISFALLVLIFVFPFWGVSYFIAGYIPVSMAGLISTSIPIAGTGSMYPTFPKGHSKDPKELGEETVATAGMLPYPNGFKIFDKKIFAHEIERGDIVVIENTKIADLTKKQYGTSSGWIKRVIALPGDSILIKDGLVYLNGGILKEPYTAKARSTFGQDYLRDCQKITIPKNKLFIMGDNRKGSGDSRYVGFVDYKDIRFVLPYKDQIGKLDKGWHDPKDDDKESARTILDKNNYLELLNKKRADEKIGKLVYEPKLERSSLLRGESILKYDDFSYEVTKSGYTQVRAMRDTGYSNIVWNEGIIQGNYNAEELIEYLFEFPDWKENLLQVKDYQDFGIAQAHGIANGCPTEVIVQHFAGYVPPNYSKEDIQSWGGVISNLNDVIPSWEKLIGHPKVNQDDLNKLIGLMYQRKNQAEAIYYRMRANQWFTNQEEKYVEQDTLLFDQSRVLTKKLNGE